MERVINNICNNKQTTTATATATTNEAIATEATKAYYQKLTKQQQQKVIQRITKEQQQQQQKTTTIKYCFSQQQFYNKDNSERITTFSDAEVNTIAKKAYGWKRHSFIKNKVVKKRISIWDKVGYDFWTFKTNMAKSSKVNIYRKVRACPMWAAGLNADNKQTGYNVINADGGGNPPIAFYGSSEVKPPTYKDNLSRPTVQPATSQ